MAVYTSDAYCISSPYANEILRRLAFFPTQDASLYTHLTERGVAGQPMQLDQIQAYAKKGVIQLELDKSCNVSMGVLR